MQSDSYAAAVAGLTPGHVNFATWFPWSTNDGNTAADINGDYTAYVANFIALAHAHGAIPVLLTAIPCVRITNSTDDAARLSVNNSLRALASSTVIVVDMDAAMTNGASPARIISGYSSDGVHPNASGSAVMAPVLTAAIEAFIASH